MSSVVKVAILGTGPIAEHHIIRQKNHRSFIPVAIFGENEDRKQYLAKKYNLVATHSLEDCLVRDVDIVDISTVNNKHFDYALDALKHNKAVIVEKPAAFTTGEIDKLIAESKEKVKPVLVVFQKRYNWTFQRILKEIKLGKLGKFLHGTATSYYPRSSGYYSSKYKSQRIYSGGGALIYQGIHDLDLVSQLIGSVGNVVGELSNDYHHLEIEDTANIYLDCLDGGRLTFSTSTNPKLSNLVENSLHFERGSAYFNNERLSIRSSGSEGLLEYRLGFFEQKALQILRRLRGNYDNILKEMADSYFETSIDSLCCLSNTREVHRIIESVYSDV